MLLHSCATLPHFGHFVISFVTERVSCLVVVPIHRLSHLCLARGPSLLTFRWHCTRHHGTGFNAVGSRRSSDLGNDFFPPSSQQQQQPAIPVWPFQPSSLSAHGFITNLGALASLIYLISCTQQSASFFVPTISCPHTLLHNIAELSSPVTASCRTTATISPPLRTTTVNQPNASACAFPSHASHV